MVCFNRLWPKVWCITFIVTCMDRIPLTTTKCSTEKKRIADWIDEKGYLKFHDDQSTPDNCESCRQLAKTITDASEVCYSAEPDEDDTNVTSICKWTENSTSDHNFEDYTIRKFFPFPSLKVLSITKYKIEQWANIDHTFVDLTALEYLYLESNHITSWSISGTQQPLTKLRVLSLANNPIANLSEGSFSWLEGSNLQYLNMRGCSNIKIVDSGVFNPLASSTNLWLDLSYTIIDPNELSLLTAGFRSKEKGCSEGLGLEVLSLAHAGLYRIPTEALENIAHSLIQISLQGNYFSNCWNTALGNEEDRGDCLLPIMNNLREINLKDCSITDFPFAIVLNATPKLEALYLDENPLGEMSCNNTSYVSYISLKNIKNDKGFQLCANGSKCLFPKLKFLDLSNTLLNTSKSSFSDLSSLEILSLRNSGVKTVTGLLGPLNNLTVLDLGNNYLGNNLTDEDFKGLSTLNELSLQSCSLQFRSSSPFQYLTNLRVLDMSNNSIRTLKASLFNGTAELTKLILQENQIAAWRTNVFNETVKNLTVLDLRNNWLSDITRAMIDDLNSVSDLDISLNPFSCFSCGVSKFFETCIKLKEDFNGTCQTKDFNFTLRHWEEPNAYMCVTRDNEQKPVVVIRSQDVCPSSSTTTIPMTTDTKETTQTSETWETSEAQDTTSSTTEINGTTYDTITDASYYNSDYDQTFTYIACASVIVLVIGFALCYWKRWNIRICARIFKRNMVMSLLKDTKAKGGRKEGYQYDVFLSYSDRDREWILQQLIPNVEERGHIKVCLHERDFEAGLPVLENIMACMDHSRCVLLVLSEAFLRSHWCQFELNLAQHRLLEMQHDRLILVLLENIPRDKSSKMLRYLMLTKTYLLWPVKGDTEEKSLFWRKLKKAIGPVHDTVNVSFA